MNKDDKGIIELTKNYIQESKEAKRDRLEKNKLNFDTYHLKQDFSHKRPGQSREFLPKQAMAVEQITTFFQQGLIDNEEWFKIATSPGVEDSLFTENERKLILQRQLDNANSLAFVGDAIKLGLLGSLMIAKVHGEFVKRPIFYTETKWTGFKNKKTLKRKEELFWQLKLGLVRQEDWFPDPTGAGLYQIENSWVDLHQLKWLADNKNPGKIYDSAVAEQIVACVSDEEEQKLRKARESGQNTTFSNYRGRVKISECWGTILDNKGNKISDNMVWTVANDRFLIQPPTENPFWHGESPYVTAPILRVPGSVWGKALMDAPTRHNVALNELYNLIFDGGMMATHGIKQIRPDWLEDTAEVENGIRPGQTIKVSSNCPAGMKVLERVDTSSISSESLSVFNLTNSEFNQSALTNDLRMGVMPQRAVKATEVVEASQTITSMFTGIAKIIETDFIDKILYKSWMTSLQNMDDMQSQEIQDLIGQKRALVIANISPEDRFAKEANGVKFKSYGITSVLSKVKDFRKLMSLLQTVAGNEMLMEEYLKKFNMGKTLEELMRALDINTDAIKNDEITEAQMAAAQMQGSGAGMAPGSTPNAQSQIAQMIGASGAQGETLQSKVQSAIPQTEFSGRSGNGL